MLGNLTNSFPQQTKKTAYDDLVGTYQGFTLTEAGLDNANQIVVELTADFKLKITENFDGLFVEHINEKLFPEAAGSITTGDYAFDFKPENKSSEFELIRVLLHKEPVIPNSDYKVSFLMKGKDQSIFTVIKEGGNPKTPVEDIKFSEIYKAELYTGKTKDDTFGDYKIEWYTSHDFGFLQYKHLKNVFRITKIERGYRVRNENKGVIELDYAYDSYKRMTLKKIKKGSRLFDKEKVKEYKKQGESQNSPKEFIQNICSSFYHLIDSRFKPRGNYTLTHDNKLNGKGIQIFMEEVQPIVYSGGFQDGRFQGDGKFILTDRTDYGTFQNGTRHGHLYMEMLDGSRASGEYVKGVQEGLWKIKLPNGATFDKVFKNGKVESSTSTNTGAKNTQIAKHVNDAQYQLKSSGRYINEIVSMANGCNDRTTLRSYQVCLRPIKRKIDLFSTGIVAADRELTKAIKEAKRIGCVNTIQILKNAEDDLWEANGNFRKAYDAITEAYHATTVSKVKSEFSKSKSALKKAGKAFDEYNIWIAALVTETCYEYSSTDNSTLPSRTSGQRKSSSKSSSSHSTSSYNNK